MKRQYFWIIIISLFLTQSAISQTSTLYYNQQGELTISELATHFRLADVDLELGRFIGDVKDFRMDSTLLYCTFYDSIGIEKFYLFNEQQDTLLIINSREELSTIPDTVMSVIAVKDGFEQAELIRKNDYPYISTILKQRAMTKFQSLLFAPLVAKPEFPGGVGEMNRFLSNVVVYPDLAKEYGVKGTVYVQMVVEKDGTLSNIKTIKGIGAGCDDAAENAIRKMPDWTPGYQRGRPVKVRFTLPVTFN